jgi:hypothetical protein
MTSTRWLALACGLFLTAGTGCCRFYDRWCGTDRVSAAPVAYAPVGNCCCAPATQAYVAPQCIPPQNPPLPAGYAPPR